MIDDMQLVRWIVTAIVLVFVVLPLLAIFLCFGGVAFLINLMAHVGV